MNTYQQKLRQYGTQCQAIRAMTTDRSVPKELEGEYARCIKAIDATVSDWRKEHPQDFHDEKSPEYKMLTAKWAKMREERKQREARQRHAELAAI